MNSKWECYPEGIENKISDVDTGRVTNNSKIVVDETLTYC